MAAYFALEVDGTEIDDTVGADGFLTLSLLMSLGRLDEDVDEPGGAGEGTNPLKSY